MKTTPLQPKQKQEMITFLDWDHVCFFVKYIMKLKSKSFIMVLCNTKGGLIPMIFFRSDYSLGAHPKVMQALIDTNLEHTDGYCLDRFSDDCTEMIREWVGKPLKYPLA